jgi:glycosyltransferase involved in cell wall biosynthesis
MHSYDKEAELISIIIPCYNTERYIGKCLNSVVKQTYKSIEVIVVDDGSSDDSASIVEQYCKNDLRFRLIKQRNGGASSARNTGLCKSKGKYITFLDSDDTLHNEAIERLYKSVNNSKSDIVVPCVFNEVYDGNKVITMKLFSPDDKENIDPISFVINKMIYCSVAWRCSSVLYKNSIIKKYNLNFDVGYTAEDFLFNLKYFRYVKSMETLSFPTLNVTKRIGSVTASYNAKLMDLYFFIDQRVIEFLIGCGINTGKEREIADSLLCRNIIVFITKEIGVASLHSYKTHSNNIKKKLNNEKVIEALKNKNIQPPFFINKKKRIVANILLKLLRVKLLRLAIFNAWLVSKLEKILIKKNS